MFLSDVFVTITCEAFNDFLFMDINLEVIGLLFECQNLITQIGKACTNKIVLLEFLFAAFKISTRISDLVNSLPTGKFFILFCCLLIYFKSTFLKDSFFLEYHLSVKQIGSRSGLFFSGLIWVQSVCKDYEQTALEGNE